MGARACGVVNDITGAPFKPEDIEIGQLINAEPAVFFEQEDPDGEIIEPEYEGVELNNAKAKAAVIVVRMRPDDITPAKGREDWGIDGILCYSKICTHVGCPISLWEQQTHQLLCPCHQSTFDLADNGKVLFGPGCARAAAAADRGRRRGLHGRAERLPRAGRTELLGTGLIAT